MRAVEDETGDRGAGGNQRVAPSENQGSDRFRQIGNTCCKIVKRKIPLDGIERQPDPTEPDQTPGKTFAITEPDRSEVNTREGQRPASSMGIASTAATAIAVAGGPDGAP
jgi:hypothetical protein